MLPRNGNIDTKRKSFPSYTRHSQIPDSKNDGLDAEPNNNNSAFQKAESNKVKGEARETRQDISENFQEELRKYKPHDSATWFRKHTQSPC